MTTGGGILIIWSSESGFAFTVTGRVHLLLGCWLDSGIFRSENFENGQNFENFRRCSEGVFRLRTSCFKSRDDILSGIGGWKPSMCWLYGKSASHPARVSREGRKWHYLIRRIHLACRDGKSSVVSSNTILRPGRLPLSVVHQKSWKWGEKSWDISRFDRLDFHELPSEWRWYNLV